MAQYEYVSFYALMRLKNEDLAYQTNLKNTGSIESVKFNEAKKL